MPTLQALQDAAAMYNRQVQELTARIYADGFVSCQEATEGTRYHYSVRPRLRRLHRLLRQRIVDFYSEHISRDRIAANDVLRSYHIILHDFDKLLNDSKVMLKIFADVLSDCPDVPVEKEPEKDS
jgi:hypothetical protein